MPVEFFAVPCVTADVLARNAAHALSLGLPAIEHAGAVAVVGGSPSAADHLDELRNWKGPIWAINQTFMWLTERGIRSTFFTADPEPQPWLKVEPGDAALVVLNIDPTVYEALRSAHVRTFELGQDEVRGTLTTATVAPHLALLLGHTSVTFFGCDSSFKGGTHAYRDDAPPDSIIVECNGAEYETKPEYMMQADALATLCRELPQFCRSRSGGLLSAMIACPMREVVRVHPAMFAEMRPVADVLAQLNPAAEAA